MALVPVLVLGVLGGWVTVPYAALGPGPTFDTLGVVEGKEVVDIEGTPVDPTTGHLNMTTVSVRDGLSLFETLGYWVSGRHGIVPRAEIYPPDKSRDEIEKENQADFAKSEDSAELAALRYLKLPIRLTVGDVGADGPAKDALRKGDELLRINGNPVDSVQAVQAAVMAAGPNSDAVLAVRRDGTEQEVTVRLAVRPGTTDKGYLGITPVEQPATSFTVDFNLADIGGPSAGLMFSLAVIDKLSPGELTGGTFVAGTGTIDAQGGVGPIGGIQYKMVAAREAGAQTFLVPARNCAEAAAKTPAGLRLVKVDKLADAIDSLKSINEGGTAATC